MRIKEIDLRTDIVKRFLNATEEKEICYLLKEYSNQFFDWQTSYLRLRGLPTSKEYSVHLSKDKSFNDYFVITSNKKTINLKALQGGYTYYYRVHGDNNFLKEGMIKTKNTPGVFYNIGGLCNVRDIGGWETVDGKRIKHGLIIRGSRTNDHDDVPSYTQEGYDLLTKALKIKGEIDFRHPHDIFGQTHNFINKDYPYLVAPFTTCCYIVPSFNDGGPNHRYYDDKTAKSFHDIFKFLLDKKNYPVFIHCNSGADRTGTICMILEGVLGVPLESIYRDFELTSFSPGTKHWRSGITDDYKFDGTGIMQDDQFNYVAAEKCLKRINNQYGPGKSIQEAITNYLKEVCNITDEDISQLKEILLEN